MSAVLKPEELKIRTLQKTDLPAIIEIENISYKYPWSERIFMDCLAAGYRCRIVLVGGTIAGYCIVSAVTEEVHILNICVSPKFRRKGCARCLIENEISIAVQAKNREIYLEVRISNQVAIELYEGLGFRKVGYRRDYYPSEFGRENAYLYSLTLENIKRRFSGLNLYV